MLSSIRRFFKMLGNLVPVHPMVREDLRARLELHLLYGQAVGAIDPRTNVKAIAFYRTLEVIDGATVGEDVWDHLLRFERRGASTVKACAPNASP